jgi:L-Ala-D/L-Glu epimerase
LNQRQRRITRFEFGTFTCPLRKPYELSFTTLSNFEAVWVFIEDDAGKIGIGETVPLPGYGSETLEDVLSCIQDLSKDADSLTAEDMKERCFAARSVNPFSASAVMMALEFPDWAASASKVHPTSLVYPLASGQQEQHLSQTIEKALSQGYKYFKMKVGRDIDQDLESAVFALNLFPQKTFRISFDANQAYKLNEALTFCRFLANQPRAHCLEQPLPQLDWDGMAELCKQTTFPLMLDESIYNEQDVRRAKEIGCSAVKLKLCKHCGLEETLSLAQLAHDLGLEVVIGNGVSTDIGNLAEALVISKAPQLFGEGAECNGFLKIAQPTTFPQLYLDKTGCMVWKNENLSLNEQLVHSIQESILNLAG